ncbi:hypothetical protein CERSUDRAFT_82818 [Gelatoporia subvermispora B]|uniref:Uncharacterized protein n=1 Tax=Ceriporiopsis subvermispora (strain B) TaxID=914234 RepID=M2PPU5_CERS8|nr:hypothetical protein CERSUDRAFT_82818 [Gelatoporia subvermispora B]
MAIEPVLGTRSQRAFMGTILLQGIVVLVMVSITFRFVAEHVDLTEPRYKTLPCYLALFILAEIFEVLMAFDALRLRNVIQLVGILAFQLALLVMSILQIHETRAALVTAPGASGSANFLGGSGPGTLWRKVLPFLIVSPIVVGISEFIMLFFVRHLYYEFGWAIFHVVGANPAAKTMYQFYQIMICLLKFDFFCFTGVTMQLLIVVLSTNSAEFGLTIAAIPIVLVLLAGCGLAVQREIKSLMTVSLVIMLAAEAYFVYKLIRFYEPDSEGQYVTTRATLTVFTIVALLLMFTTFVVGLRCFTDFDKGLLSSKLHGQFYRPVNSSLMDDLFGGATHGKTSYNAGSQLEPRISIE